MPGLDTDAARVVLVLDSRWAAVPGVCCWRQSFREAFAASGAAVAEVGWRPGWPASRPVPLPGTEPVTLSTGRPAAQPRTASTTLPVPRSGRVAPSWLPASARRGARLAIRGTRRARRLARRAGGTQPAAIKPGVGPVIKGLDGAALVVAESLDAALAAIRSGTPRHRVWTLVLPEERTHDGLHRYGAELLAAAAPHVGGFVTDSELARESIERATAESSRPPVVVFPPLAMDRSCPSCLTGTGPQLDGAGLDPAVAQLTLWRWLMGQHRGGAAPTLPYSFPAARLRGLPGPWEPWRQPDWTEEDAKTTPLRADDPPAAPWSRQAQEAAAAALLDAVGPRAAGAAAPSRDVVVTGYDLKFIRELAERLDRRADLAVTVDEWPHLSKRGPHTETRTARAQAIVAEWARPSAVWLSRRKRRDQLLVVRLHRYEIESRYPRDLAIGNVDAVVYIAPLMGRRIRDELGWPVDKLVYVPNFLDVDWLDRPKLADARFALGLVGIVPKLKRLDLALDLLAAVRQEDPRFTLVVRSAMPWSNDYVWRKPEEREYYGWCFERIERDPLLRTSVVFDLPGRDMARWLRRVGHILSASDVEGSHTAVAEGMASGAVPVVRPWDGAAELYGDEWIRQSTEHAAQFVLDDADPDRWAARAARARAEVRRTHDPASVEAAWADLLHGRIEQARARFAPYSGLSDALSDTGTTGTPTTTSGAG